MSSMFETLCSVEALNELFDDRFNRALAAGVDGMSAKQFKAQVDTVLPTLSRKLLDGSFRFSAYKEKLILKSRDKPPRAVYIPTIRDRLVIAMLAELIKKSVPPSPSKLGEAKAIVRDLVSEIDSEKYDSFIKLDIKQCYPSIDHALLFEKLSSVITHQRALDLIRAALRNRVFDQMTNQACSPVTDKGVPQGLAISSLLAEFFMRSMDALHVGAGKDYRYYRFVDDVCVLCNHEQRNAIKEKLVEDFSSLKLEAHAVEEGGDKSEVGSIESGFQYLGYTFSKDGIGVRRSSLDKMYRRIDQVFSEYQRDEGSKERKRTLYEELNKRITGLVRSDGVLIGWLAYFRHLTKHEILFDLDRYVKRACEHNGVGYDESKIKKFSRAVYEIRRYPNSSYIPKVHKPTMDDLLLDEFVVASNAASSKSKKLKDDEQKLAETALQELARNYELEQILDVESDLALY